MLQRAGRRVRGRLCGVCEGVVRQGMARGMMGSRLYSGLRAAKEGEGVA